MTKILKSGYDAQRKQGDRQAHHTLALFIKRAGGSVFRAFNTASSRLPSVPFPTSPTFVSALRMVFPGDK